jgi:hypothetical protein
VKVGGALLATGGLLALTGCGQRLKPKPGDCCVFCSYGDIVCPPRQQTSFVAATSDGLNGQDRVDGQV